MSAIGRDAPLSVAEACVPLKERGYDGPMVNMGTGTDVTIRELAEPVVRLVGIDGEIVFNAKKPDGTPMKPMDVGRLSSLGWQAQPTLKGGVKFAVQAFLASRSWRSKDPA